jgi:hypothetical protein
VQVSGEVEVGGGGGEGTVVVEFCVVDVIGRVIEMLLACVGEKVEEEEARASEIPA